MKFKPLVPVFIAFVCGLISVVGFAPYYIFPLPIFALAILFGLWIKYSSVRLGIWLGFSFGLGLFISGIGWIYIALHDYGGMPVAAAGMSTIAFAAFLSLFPALAGYAQARISVPIWTKCIFVMPAVWVLSEWTRGTLFTGFPWLTLGYSQTTGSPIAGYAPVLGVYGVSLILSISAGLLLWLYLARWNRAGKIAWTTLAAIWIFGFILKAIPWTHPHGEPFKIALLQGNISQEFKFQQASYDLILEKYLTLVKQSDARLIVMPETALPSLLEQLPKNYITSLTEIGKSTNSDILVGVFESDQQKFYNSVISLGVSESQTYRKDHLVPFGEFIPFRPVLGWLINDILNIPMGDLNRGGKIQPLMHIAGQKVAINICFEDVFGEEIIRKLPEASLLVNVSNDAWYGESSAAIQHNQIAQMRALETGRMMLRATNTGVTSVIAPNGRTIHMLPQHEESILEAMVQGYSGTTPYVRTGNSLVLFLIFAMLLLAWRLPMK